MCIHATKSVFDFWQHYIRAHKRYSTRLWIVLTKKIGWNARTTSYMWYRINECRIICWSARPITKDHHSIHAHSTPLIWCPKERWNNISRIALHFIMPIANALSEAKIEFTNGFICITLFYSQIELVKW